MSCVDMESTALSADAIRSVFNKYGHKKLTYGSINWICYRNDSPAHIFPGDRMGDLELRQKIMALVCRCIIPPIYRRGDYFMPVSKRKKSTAAITKISKQ